MSEEIEEKKRVFKTSSIVLAATLVHEKMKLAGLEPMPNRSPDLFYFVFDDEDRRRELIMSFSNNTLLVSPSMFMENVRQLKQRAKEYNADNR